MWTFGHGLCSHHIRRRANSEYPVASVDRSATGPESSASGTISPINVLKYRPPLQPTYKFLSQSTATASTVIYDPQQHTTHNSYNMQQLLPKVPQKVS